MGHACGDNPDRMTQPLSAESLADSPADSPRPTSRVASARRRAYRVAELRQELDVPQLVLPWAHAHADFRRNRRARIGTRACGRLRDGSVSGAAGGGERSPRCWRGGGQAWRVQNQAGKPRADAAAGRGQGNSRLHLHPRRHSRRSGHALRAPGHHHWSALASCASDECTRSGAWRHAESKASAGKIGARSTCCGASVSSLDECPARARPRSLSPPR